MLQLERLPPSSAGPGLCGDLGPSSQSRTGSNGEHHGAVAECTEPETDAELARSAAETRGEIVPVAAGHPPGRWGRGREGGHGRSASTTAGLRPAGLRLRLSYRPQPHALAHAIGAASGPRHRRTATNRHWQCNICCSDTVRGTESRADSGWPGESRWAQGLADFSTHWHCNSYCSAKPCSRVFSRSIPYTAVLYPRPCGA